MAISTGEPGREILQPMAVVMLADLFTSTILDIVYTPAFFWRWRGPVAERLVTPKENQPIDEDGHMARSMKAQENCQCRRPLKRITFPHWAFTF
ncbi:MAG: hypothetical protein HYV27_00975 [Candidatus Hydrogenedentes bacterium]|nr:hypothetical protein [Candidatus Hydrogenedentota bacterium]